MTGCYGLVAMDRLLWTGCYGGLLWTACYGLDAMEGCYGLVAMDWFLWMVADSVCQYAEVTLRET